MNEISLDSIAAASLVLAVLFALRYFLAMRRIFQEVPKPAGFGLAGYLKAPQRGAYGEDMEPNRRYASRQFHQGAVFLVVGVGLFAYLLATGTPITLGQGI
ncbi:MAG: hypothetical protein ABW026_17755 [Microvirga sp.]